MYGVRRLEETVPRRALDAVGFDDGGYVVKLTAEDSQQKVEKVDGLTDAIYGVNVDDTKDATTDQVENGRLVDVFRHGIVPVRSEAVTWDHGDTAFIHTNGHVTNVDGGSASVLGTYVGEDQNTVAQGDKVTIDLDSSVSEVI